jgi:hypothetical protein
MKRTFTIPIVAGLVAAVLITASPLPALSQPADVLIVNVQAVAEGYRISKLIGSAVLNDKDQRIGTIDDIIVGRDRVLFAVLQVGGFLGLGGRLVAVPYKSLVLDHPGGKIVLPGATRDELEKLPVFKYLG